MKRYYIVLKKLDEREEEEDEIKKYEMPTKINTVLHFILYIPRTREAARKIVQSSFVDYTLFFLRKKFNSIKSDICIIMRFANRFNWFEVNFCSFLFFIQEPFFL